jgi:hypothetical protein
MSEEKFEAWGIVDLFGHVRIAGRISEQAIGGETFIRVDVPNDPAKPDSYHTRLFGKGAIYSISLTDEAIAREFAKRSGTRPVSAYDVPALLKDQAPTARPRALSYANDEEEDDDPIG